MPHSCLGHTYNGIFFTRFRSLPLQRRINNIHVDIFQRNEWNSLFFLAAINVEWIFQEFVLNRAIKHTQQFKKTTLSAFLFDGT